MTGNKQWVVLREPESKYPIEGKDIELREAEIPEPGEDEFLVQILALTVDPYLRMTMTPVNFYTGQHRDYPFVVEGGAVGKIVKSNNAKYPVGALVSGGFGWQEYAVSKGGDLVNIVDDSVRPSHSLGVLGMPGATAYLGLTKILDPKAGDVLVVSGAAGAVGSLVGQIAKILGLTVIGFAGGETKCNFLTQELGFDHAINYEGKSEDDLAEELKTVAPNGVDSYFDNTGSSCTEAVLKNIKTHGRISICGQIANYGTSDATKISLSYVLMKQLHVEGFIINKWAEDWPKAHSQMQAWIAEGKLKVQEDITVGIDNTFEAFLELFKQGKDGKANLGKKIVILNAEEESVQRQTVARPEVTEKGIASIKFSEPQFIFGTPQILSSPFGYPTAAFGAPTVSYTAGPQATFGAPAVTSFGSSLGYTSGFGAAGYSLPATAGTPIYQSAYPTTSVSYAAAPAVFSPTFGGVSQGFSQGYGFTQGYTAQPVQPYPAATFQTL